KNTPLRESSGSPESYDYFYSNSQHLHWNLRCVPDCYSAGSILFTIRMFVFHFPSGKYNSDHISDIFPGFYITGLFLYVFYLV
ncbi:TPA: hypothetical protein ACYSHT_005070, partial [Escherichia coli]